MEKILVYEDRGKQQAFRKDAEAVKNAANALIQTFEEFQEFKRITTLAEFELLCSEPVEYFDETIKANVSLKMIGGREPDPAILAELFNIDRQNYISIIKGLPVTEGCKPCQQLKVIKKARKPALTYLEYEHYKNFLLFEAGSFNLNTEAIADRLEKFKAFAETPAQLSTLKHWQSLVDTLNKHDELYPINNPTKQAIAKNFNLTLSQAIAGSFGLYNEYMKNLLMRIQ
jgi:hypothetical protein